MSLAAAAATLAMASAAMGQAIFVPPPPEHPWVQTLWSVSFRSVLGALAAVLLVLLLRWRRGGQGWRAREWAGLILAGLVLLAAAGAVLSVPKVYGIAGGPGGEGWTAGEALLWIIGAGMWFTAATLLWWQVLGDRSRGRRRCPRCWYDMSGTPGLTCPECGRAARTERALFRTRRRRGVIALAGVLLLAGWGTCLWPTASSGRWRTHVPDTVLIAAMPRLSGHSLYTELNRRMNSLDPGCSQEWYDGLWGWQRRMLIRRARAAVESGRDPQASHLGIMALFRAGEDAAAHADFLLGLMRGADPALRRDAAAVLRRIPSATDAFLSELFRLLESADDQTAATLLIAMTDPLRREPERKDIREVLFRYVRSAEHPQASQWALHLLPEVRPLGEALDVLREVVRDPSPPHPVHRLIAARGLVTVDPESEATAAALIEGLRHALGTGEADTMASFAARHCPKAEGVWTLAAAAVEDQGPQMWEFAVRAWFGWSEHPLPDRVEYLAKALEFPHLRVYAAEHLAELGADAAPALPALRRALEAEDGMPAEFEVYRAIERIERAAEAKREP